jgi:hypothetical protein
VGPLANGATNLRRIVMLSVRRGLAAVMIVAAVSSAARAADSDALKPGMVLDQSNWKLAEGLLPPEILKHYEEGGYSNKIVDFPLGSFNWPPDFKASTEKNAGQFKLSETGTVVLNSTGEQPPFILGLPFPILDSKDPQAGPKILWNFFYLTWYYGNLHAESQVMGRPEGDRAPLRPGRQFHVLRRRRRA